MDLCSPYIITYGWTFPNNLFLFAVYYSVTVQMHHPLLNIGMLKDICVVDSLGFCWAKLGWICVYKFSYEHKSFFLLEILTEHVIYRPCCSFLCRFFRNNQLCSTGVVSFFSLTCSVCAEVSVALSWPALNSAVYLGYPEKLLAMMLSPSPHWWTVFLMHMSVCSEIFFLFFTVEFRQFFTCFDYVLCQTGFPIYHL